MADNFENHGYDPEKGGPPPGGVDPNAPLHDPARRPGIVPTGMPPHDAPAVKVGPPSSYRAPEPVAEEDDGRIKRPFFPVVLAGLMALTLLASWVVSKRPAEASPAPATTTTTATAAAPTPAVEPAGADSQPAADAKASADAPGLGEKVKDLSQKVDALTAQLKTVEGKLDDHARPEPAPDLKPVQGKLDDLAKSVAGLAPLSEKVEKVNGHLGRLDGQLKSVKDEVAGLKDEVKQAAAAASPKPAEAAKPADDDSAAMNEGVDLFKAGKYKEADDVFKKLASANPKDARVYYYAALTNGLTTKKWDGETVTTAAKGAALEKAGTTRPSDVDAAFSGLPDSLKPWLDFFRKQAK